MSSLVGGATRAAVFVTAGVLAAVGIATAGFLHLQAVAARDQAMAALLLGGQEAEDGEVDGVDLPFRVVDARDVPDLPAAWVDRARREERVVAGDLGDLRVLVGVSDEEDDDDRRHGHRVRVAVGPRVTLARSVGPFLVTWAGTAAAGVLLAAALQRWQLGRAVAPLSRAVAEASAAARLGPSARLTEDGPDEVRALLVAVNGLLGRLEDAFAAQTRFTAEAAHELRTPVTALVGEIDVALRRPRSASETRDTLERVGESARRLADLVEGLLTLARLDTGLTEDVRELRVAEDLVRAAVSQEQAEIAGAGLRLTTELAGEHPVSVHPPLVVTAIATLLRNAARYAAGAPVVVRVTGAGDLVRVEVDDGGPGIAPAERAGVFDRFSRGASARRVAPEGLGLGLPLARAVARGHGGECRVEASPLGGCRVVFELPIPRS